jgi:hypothetical protein
VLIQKWRRRGELFEREHFGNESVRSDVLEAWFVVRHRRLIIANDRDGTDSWQDDAEREREAKQRALDAVERERALNRELERELVELRAKADG